MPEQLQLPLPWRYWGVRPYEVCGRKHAQINSPRCYACRYRASKHPCAIPGCHRLISENATTCLWYRSQQVSKPRVIHVLCRECGAEMTPSPIHACHPCRAHTYRLCACGCGRYRRKDDTEGHIRLYISGHNDVWGNHRRPLIACIVCRKPFRPKARRQRLRSIPCRTVWLTLNPPNEKKRVMVECAICGTQVGRKLSGLRQGQDAVCSRRCQYILVANKLRGRNLSLPMSLALRRDKARCRTCGFDTMVDVHHIIARRHGGPNTLDNLITLCPNHHTMADRGLITVEELRALLTDDPFTVVAKLIG
jgi:hypothetical protein